MVEPMRFWSEFHVSFFFFESQFNFDELLFCIGHSPKMRRYSPVFLFVVSEVADSVLIDIFVYCIGIYIFNYWNIFGFYGNYCRMF